jgi:myo-inositol 2-dehydrogenase/D-chiro-inositol 1-dehydrogenase
MLEPLRLGVIGLGRRWRRRYKPALRTLADSFVVRGLYDQIQMRAQREARRLGADTLSAPTALMERDDIDAVLVADLQWFGLWPVELACRFGKPVFCGVSLGLDEAQVDGIQEQVQAERLPVMVAMPPRYLPATAWLREVLRTTLGPPRFLVCDLVRAPRPASLPPLFRASSLALVDWCAGLFEAEPTHVRATGVEGMGLVSVFWEFPGGRAVQMGYRPVPQAKPAWRVQVITDRGAATVAFPNRVRWTADCRHTVTLPRGQPAVRAMLHAFFEAVRGGRAPEPSWMDAYRVLRWLRAARDSLSEGAARMPAGPR